MFIKVPEHCIPQVRYQNQIPRPPSSVRVIQIGPTIYGVTQELGNYYATAAYTNRKGCMACAFKGYMYEVRGWQLPE